MRIFSLLSILYEHIFMNNYYSFLITVSGDSNPYDITHVHNECKFFIINHTIIIEVHHFF